jgi:hypothetical protein
VIKGSNFTLDKSVNIDDEYFKLITVNKYNRNLEKLKIDDFVASCFFMKVILTQNLYIQIINTSLKNH